jgi:3'(2'), 5'-bisphosphate nucleotidase
MTSRAGPPAGLPKSPALELAVRTVVDAARVARAVQARLGEVRALTKDDRSPVTVADFAVQAVVAMALRERDGAARIVGEERSDLLRSAGGAAVLEAVVQAVRTVRPGADARAILEAIDGCDHDGSGGSYWALDPIDGTKGFLRGQQYAIALAFLEHGEVVLGAMGCPNLPADHAAPLDVAGADGTTYGALRGGGAWELRGAAAARRIAAARFTPGRAVRVCESVEKEHTSQSDSARIAAALGTRSEPVRLDSQCKYAVVARGQADAYLRLPTKGDYVEKIWDHAAGCIIATEAGARVSDVTGSPLDFGHGRRLERNRGIICAAADLHPRIIAVIDELGIGAAV